MKIIIPCDMKIIIPCDMKIIIPCDMKIIIQCDMKIIIPCDMKIIISCDMQIKFKKSSVAILTIAIEFYIVVFLVTELDLQFRGQIC